MREAPDKLRRAYRELWLLPLLMGLGIFLVFILIGLVAIGYVEPAVTSAIAGAGCTFGTPLLVVALLNGMARSIAMAWIGFVIELLVVLSFLVGDVNVFSILIAGLTAIVPFMTVFHIFEIKELQDLQLRHPAGPAPRG
jgi:hypothetical protein